MDYYEQQLELIDWSNAHALFGSDGATTKALTITPDCARAIIRKLADVFCRAAPAATETPKLRIGYDQNGNQRLHVSRGGGRAFSVQTLDNLPHTHRYGLAEHTLGELRDYLRHYGTKRQRAIGGI